MMIKNGMLKLYLILNLFISKALNTEFKVLIVSVMPTSIIFHILLKLNNIRKGGKSDQ